MNTDRRSIYSFYFRIFTICLIIFTSFWGKAYAQDLSNLLRPSVISPYWQSDSTSYTFIAVTHPSLSDIASQVGVQINAIKNDKTAFNTALSFTISAGETQRVFIVRTGHSIINPTIIPSGSFIQGTTNYSYGSIIINPVATAPDERTPSAGIGAGYRDVTMLSFFGGIVFDSATTGFAMEFVGDVHDSEATIYMHKSATVSGVN